MNRRAQGESCRLLRQSCAIAGPCASPFRAIVLSCWIFGAACRRKSKQARGTSFGCVTNAQVTVRTRCRGMPFELPGEVEALSMAVHLILLKGNSCPLSLPLLLLLSPPPAEGLSTGSHSIWSESSSLPWGRWRICRASCVLRCFIGGQESSPRCLRQERQRVQPHLTRGRGSLAET